MWLLQMKYYLNALLKRQYVYVADFQMLPFQGEVLQVVVLSCLHLFSTYMGLHCSSSIALLKSQLLGFVLLFESLLCDYKLVYFLG